MGKRTDLGAYLREHYAYELLMLRYTHARLRSTNDHLLWNAIFESCAMHARNLRDFYTNKGGNRTLGAKDFEALDIGKRNYDPGAFQKINEQMEHLSTQRASTAEDGKLTLDRLDDIVAWLEDCHREFVKESSAVKKFEWSEVDGTDPQIRTPPSGYQPSATNLISFEALTIDPLTRQSGNGNDR